MKAIYRVETTISVQQISIIKAQTQISIYFDTDLFDLIIYSEMCFLMQIKFEEKNLCGINHEKLNRKLFHSSLITQLRNLCELVEKTLS